MKSLLMWNEKENIMAVVDLSYDLPWIYVVDKDYEGDYPFIAYPLCFLPYWGWINLGEF